MMWLVGGTARVEPFRKALEWALNDMTKTPIIPVAIAPNADIIVSLGGAVLGNLLQSGVVPLGVTGVAYGIRTTICRSASKVFNSSVPLATTVLVNRSAPEYCLLPHKTSLLEIALLYLTC